MNKRRAYRSRDGFCGHCGGRCGSIEAMTLDLDHAVLLPIDMQQAFDAPPWPRRWNRNVDKNGLALLAAWRAAGRPIVHVRHDSVQPGSTLAQGTPGHAFRPGFEPA